MPSETIIETELQLLNFQHKNGCEGHKGQICCGPVAPFPKLYATRSTICVESFILVSKSAHKGSFWPYIYHYIIADQHPYLVKNRIEYNKSHLLTPDLILQSSVVSGLSG